MKMILKKLLQKLETEEYFPVLKCPLCENGNLKTSTKDEIRFTSEKTKKIYEITGEPIDLKGEFAKILLCDNSECLEKAIVIGKTDTVENGYDDGIDKDSGEELYPAAETYTSKYKIEYISLPVNLISIPENIDLELLENIQSSYNLFWSDINSCGNRLRTVIELLLDIIKIPPANTLNNRLEKLKKDTINIATIYP